MTPWLVADIGGTNARFGLVRVPGEGPVDIAVLAGADYASLPEAVAAYLADHAGGVRPEAACVAVAGPIDGDTYQLTNLPWRGSIRDLGIPRAVLLNDFEALAVSLPHLDGDDLVTLGGPPPGHGVKAVLGPGTGLGVAGLVPSEQGWIPIPGEGGHATVPVFDERDLEIVRVLRQQGLRHVEAEHVLSGPGIARLHRALAVVNGVSAPVLSSADIVARVDDSLCAETVEVFCGMLGGFAGNVALTLGARGGVYLGGGVLPRIVDRVRAGSFRARFETGPNLSGYLPAIATSLIVAPQPALVGAAAWLTQHLTSRSVVHEPA
ncbi:glucokinase [Nonomuraea sp. NBC_01738]|uniref:glucokinase n=1 Tax=Nonomuraea sp. NBC_01738 TaxID=2976003 RepID=UPI002E168346|nr:glucokinase [Nonomuraea sp. NBC_01738]